MNAGGDAATGPVLVVDDDGAAPTARAVGAAAYLRKPFDLDDLTPVVRAVLAAG